MFFFVLPILTFLKNFDGQNPNLFRNCLDVTSIFFFWFSNTLDKKVPCDVISLNLFSPSGSLKLYTSLGFAFILFCHVVFKVVIRELWSDYCIFTPCLVFFLYLVSTYFFSSSINNFSTKCNMSWHTIKKSILLRSLTLFVIIFLLIDPEYLSCRLFTTKTAFLSTMLARIFPLEL